ncbi:RluA family pseudouridine synthase [Tenacibaculum xiamenense]|uniref:RluA family pseudouridine synthase n=1 Tax=Tenacibaculum xiamenense TaxID=1261553 RepID=UPI0038948569
MHTTKESLQVLFEDNHIIVVNKRCGDITQGDKTGDAPLSDIIKEYLKEKYNKPGNVFLGTVHRLDRPTSGIVIYAKTSKALERLNKMFRDKKVTKTYWAIVKGHPKNEQGSLSNFLKKNPKLNKSFVYKKEITGSKKAILHYYLVKKLQNYSLLQINLETGRHHQIRVQLSHINHPIKGDLKYGDKRSNDDGGISLHARKIEFTHPVSKENIKITAPTPQNSIWKACS